MRESWRTGVLRVGFVIGMSVGVWAHPTSDERLIVLNRQIADEPRNAMLYLARGHVLRDVGDWDGALADYERAERHAPGLDLINLARGQLFLESGRSAEAEPLLHRFLSSQPKHAEARVARARALARLGRGREAAADYTRAIIGMQAPNVDTYLERAEALLDAGAVGEALRGLDEGLAALGPLTVLQRRALEIEIGRTHYDAALARLEILVEHSPLRERWLMRRGEVLELAGRPEHARAAYDEAVATIESRPANRRQTEALKKLDRELRTALARLLTRGG